MLAAAAALPGLLLYFAAHVVQYVLAVQPHLVDGVLPAAWKDVFRTGRGLEVR